MVAGDVYWQVLFVTQYRGISMRKIRWLFLLYILVSSSAFATNPGGLFGPAVVNKNSEYPNATYRRDQYAFEYYSAFNGYHTGEDWNYGTGLDDYKHPLYALSKGRVVYIDDRTGSDSIGKSIYVRYKLPNGTEVDSLYIHLYSIAPGIYKGKEVNKGDLIARIGDSNGYYTNNSHLHWEIQTDLNIPIRANSYLGDPTCSNPPTGCPNREPMTPTNVLKYTSPSMFVDDRSRQESHVVVLKNTWVTFTVNDYAPSSTAYLDIGNGDLYTINRAVAAGLMPSYGIIFYDGLSWRAYNNVMDIHFEPGVTYAIKLNNKTGTFYTMPPSYKYRNDRALFDMTRFAKEDYRFDKVRTETSASYNESDPDFYYRKMAIMFTLSDGSKGGAYFYHATSKKNPLVRYVYKYKINSDSWEWVSVDKNTLY